MLKYEYAREALKTGLKLESELGVNPYKFGMIGSTDSHTSLSTAEEDNFFGKHSGVEPEPHRWDHVVIQAPDPAFTVLGWQQAASGLAVVWATENTREAIFDAMQRKETYATTGTRMTVRFFGGWDFTPEDATSRLPAAAGYQKGVPMGGDLPTAPDGQGADLPRRRAEGRLSAATSTASRSSRAGSTPAAPPRKRSTTSPGATTASRARTASCRRSATPSTWRARPGPTPSATPS